VSPHTDPPLSPQVHVLRRRAAVFGGNAPLWRSMNREFKRNYLNGAQDTGEWPQFTISPQAGHVDLDAVFAEVRPGSFAALVKGASDRTDARFPSGTYVELYKVTSTIEVSRAEFAISGKVTRIGLEGQNLDSKFSQFPRATSVYLQSEPLALAPYPVSTAIGGARARDRLPLAVAADGLQPGRRLIIRGKGVDGGELVHEAGLVGAASHDLGAMLTVTPPLPAPLERDTVVVHANVALATHGETVLQILGAGDASRSFQRFELKRMPLTYRSAASEAGADSELSVRVDGVEWAERPTLFGAAPAERAYTLSTDEQGKTSVVFGDGVRGARPPRGVNNVRAGHREGGGRAGNVGAEKLMQLRTRPLGLKGVSNPVAAQGGTDPEPADQARRTMPLGTRTLGRAVSLLDYEDFAIAFSGIAKAQAQVLQLPVGPTVAITVAGQDGAALSPANPVWNNLLLALKGSGDPHVNVVLLSRQMSSFRLGLKVKPDPAYEREPLLAAVEAALRAHYSFAARALAQPVLQSDVIAVAHSVPGVVAVDLDFLYAAQAGQSCQARLLAARMRVSGGVALAAELLTLHPDPLDRLEEMP
jgi:hypothetical protein